MRILITASLILLVCAASGCDSADVSEPPATTGTISGVISLPPGSPGSVVNTRVALYTSFDDYLADRFAQQTATDASGNYTITDIVPGTYYMEAWKDNDGSGTINDPDFYGVWGTLSASGTQLTPIPVSAGSSTTISFQIQRVGGPAIAPITR